MRKMSIAIVACIVTIFLALTVYIWWKYAQPSVSPRASEKITLAINPGYPGSAPVLVAIAKGYFEREGLLVTTQAYTSGKATLDAVLEARAEVATTADIPFLFASMARAPISLIATMSIAGKDQGIVARRDKGISIPADLKGKRIGVTLGTGGHFLLDSFLSRHGISLDAVTRVNLKPEELLPAFVKGEVQAACTWQPVLGALQKEFGDKALTFYGEDTYQIPFNLVGLQEFAKKRPGTVRRILSGVIKATDFIRSNPSEARAIFAEASRIDPTLVGELWPLYSFAVRLDQSLILALEDQARWAIKNKLTEASGVPNFLDFIDVEDLRAIAPIAVTIIR